MIKGEKRSESLKTNYLIKRTAAEAFTRAKTSVMLRRHYLARNLIRHLETQI